MVNVQENYKLVNVFVGKEEKTVKVNTSEAWNVMEFEFDGVKTTINEGDEVQFVVESGEIKTGTIVKLTGKGEKTKIKIVPNGLNCEEIWSVMSIQEGSLKVLGEEEENENNED